MPVFLHCTRIHARTVTGRMDYFGPVVNASARISDAGHGGQIVVSDEVLEVIHKEKTENKSKAFGEMDPEVTTPSPLPPGRGAGENGCVCECCWGGQRRERPRHLLYSPHFTYFTHTSLANAPLHLSRCSFRSGTRGCTG